MYTLCSKEIKVFFCPAVSICLSVTLVYCIQIAEDVSLFLCLLAPSLWFYILLALHKVTPQRGVKYTWVEKFAIFD